MPPNPVYVVLGIEPRAPYMPDHPYQLSHVFSPALYASGTSGGTLELFSRVTTKRSWWDPGLSGSGSDSEQTHGPGWHPAAYLEVRALHDKH